MPSCYTARPRPNAVDGIVAHATRNTGGVSLILDRCVGRAILDRRIPSPHGETEAPDMPRLRACSLSLAVLVVAGTAWSQTHPSLTRFASGRKYALLVGVEKYASDKIPPARFADRDADALANVLKTKLSKPYDEVVVLTDKRAAHYPILSALEKLSKRCRSRDTLLVFFACHGIPLGKEVFLAPHDMTQQLTVRGISIQDVVRRYLSPSDAGQKILILDTCYSGVAVDVDQQGQVKWGRRSPRGFEGITQEIVSRDTSLAIITAASNHNRAMVIPVLGTGSSPSI